jgi:hypothetical protein
MFSLFCRSVSLMMATALLAFAPVFPAQASAEEKAEGCLITAAGRCAFTAGREGAHRIQLTLPPAQAAKLRDLVIGGQQCPLKRQQPDSPDGAVHVTCFAYLSGGLTYELTVPDGSQTSVVKADPTNGEPVTIIP